MTENSLKSNLAHKRLHNEVISITKESNLKVKNIMQRIYV